MRFPIIERSVLAGLAGFWLWAGPASASPCDPTTLLPTDSRDGEQRIVRPEDIIRLRDVGSDIGEGMSVSPRGDFIAFTLRQGDAASNRICSAVILLGTAHGARPTVIDDGGDPVLSSADFRGKADFLFGTLSDVVPKWSPDGTWFAYLKKLDGRIQLWIAGPAMSPRQVSHTAWDIREFAIEPNGRGIIIGGKAKLRDLQHRIELEASNGFHYDGRYSPMTSTRPFVPAPVETDYFRLDPQTGKTRPSTAEERHWASDRLAAEPGSRASSIGTAMRLSTDPVTPSARIVFVRKDGTTHRCNAAECNGRVSRPWWSPNGSTINFLRQEGWSNRTTALYSWDIVSDEVRRGFTTDAVLTGCQSVGAGLFCLRQDADTPNQIVRIDRETGQYQIHFDPNPEFQNLILGKKRRLQWRNAQGFQCYGHLVLPANYRSGDKYPLVIVGYEDHGFLRGGTGDDYPIYAFAGAGFAVLSYNNPPMLGIARGAKSFVDIQHVNLQGDAERESILSCVEGGVGLAIASGSVDPKKIGMTGFSDGTATMQYALLNRNWVAVAASSHGGWEPNYALAVGPSANAELTSYGYPEFGDTGNDFWKRNSFRVNADHINAPVLFQVPEMEFMSALEGYTALKSAGKPVDMYVFPGEYHVKWQPAHRLAVYRRAIDWFSFWLKGSGSATTRSERELAYWETLRDSADANVAVEVVDH